MIFNLSETNIVGGIVDPANDGKTHLFVSIPGDGISYTWNMTNHSVSGSSVSIDWGDGVVENDISNPSHVYSKSGDYEITFKVISGDASITGTGFGTNSTPTSFTTATHSKAALLQRAYFYDENLYFSTSDDITFGTIFRGCCALQKCVFDTERYNKIVAINQQAFDYCFLLNGIELPRDLQTINNYAFRGHHCMTELTIPSAVNQIKTQVFYAATNLREIHMLPVSPPTIASNTFNSTQSLKTIYVPSGSLADYKAAEYWSAKASLMVEE